MIAIPKKSTAPEIIVQYQLDAITAVKEGLDIAVQTLKEYKEGEDPELTVKLVHSVAQTSAALSNLIKNLGRAQYEGWIKWAEVAVEEAGQQKLS